MSWQIAGVYNRRKDRNVRLQHYDKIMDGWNTRVCNRRKGRNVRRQNEREINKPPRGRVPRASLEATMIRVWARISLGYYKTSDCVMGYLGNT
jgi:hypothetical protein